ncbi:carotenoid biosynthesis protein [Hydrogenophaga sp. 5NK40-0174]|uniref:carotenoid biosynthesis protein n=1 Tax=Hydrogenophaga sp. 5NK40-0174 TaxID=3127649 RepID=UPI00310C7750
MGSLRLPDRALLGLGLTVSVVLVTESLFSGRGLITTSLVVASVVMFMASLWSALKLLGAWPTQWFVAVALPIGWFAEQMGSSRGWFFGRYTYTDVLGWQLANVPVVIPLMWFALVFIGYVMASLLLWQKPVLSRPSMGSGLLTILLTAMVVTAFDLGADPYFVFVLKAWIMEKRDGGWFGETLQGFVGWMFIASVIAAAWMSRIRQLDEPAPLKVNRLAVLVPLLTYGGELVFQVIEGDPIEVRAVAVFAMGIPLLVCLSNAWRWARSPSDKGGEQAQEAVQ